MKKTAAILVSLASTMTLAASTHTASWIAPTTNTDGSTISSPLTYNVYEGGKGTEVKTQTGVTSLTATVSGPCVQVTAVENGNESIPSAEVCLQIPNPPTNVSVK